MLERLKIGDRYSHDEIWSSLGVSNNGGIRTRVRAGNVERAVVMTSLPGLHGSGENPYHDRLENGILIYTAAGKSGEQSLSGQNQRLAEQAYLNFPIHGFILIASRRDKAVGAKRWKYLGLLQHSRHYPDNQIGADGKLRRVWLFEFRLWAEPQEVPITLDRGIWDEIRRNAPVEAGAEADAEVLVAGPDANEEGDAAAVENVRGRLLALEPRGFELFVRDLLVKSGFDDVAVTRYSSDGGIDINARAGRGLWVLQNTLVQVQAKRWLHSVGRREVAELRGSLQPFARGSVVTTGHFSRAATLEASEAGKNPIVLVDGFRLSRVAMDCGLLPSV